MIVIDLTFDKPGVFDDVPDGKFIETKEPVKISGLSKGTVQGNPTVAIALYLPYKGGCIMGQTSLKLFLTAADALKARYGDPREAE